MRIKADIEGLNETVKKFKGVMTDIEQILGEAVKAGADIIRDDAKSRINSISGQLAKGVISKVTWDKKKSKAFAATFMNPEMNNVFVVHSKSGVRYYIPAAVEYGHRTPGAAVNIELTKKGQRLLNANGSVDLRKKGVKKKTRKQVKARPFMRPAMKANKGRVLDAIETRIANIINKGGG